MRVTGFVAGSSLFAAAFSLVTASQAVAGPISIVIDYSLDSNNFFGATGSAQRLAMQAAANTLGNRLNDNLSAITPGGGNTWTENFTNPSTGGAQVISNPTVNADTLVVYVGARVLGGSTLGQGGPGGFGSGGSAAWLDLVAARGQAGALLATPTDFGPWGGAIAFDSASTWNFGLGGPVGGQNDFYSVALHELGHVLGIGTAGSWTTDVSSGNFIGPNAEAANGGNPVALDGASAHWADGTQSTFNGSPQEAAMDPSLTVGTRKEFTVLDFAGLSDIGWDVISPVPEPSTVFAAAFGVLGLAYAVRRRIAA